MTISILKRIFETYSPMLYGVALEICGTKELAEEIIIKTFEKIYKQNIGEQVNDALFIPLIKILFQTTGEHLKEMQVQHAINQNPFEKTTELRNVLIGLKDSDVGNNAHSCVSGKLLREEINKMRKENILS